MQRMNNMEYSISDMGSRAWVPVVGFLSLCCTCAAETPIRVFILAGQSNMVGGNPMSTLEPALVNPQEDVLYAYQLPDVKNKPVESDWEFLRPLTEVFGTTYGPELFFGRLLADTLGEPIAIIKSADNGSSLSTNWNPDSHELYDGMTRFVDDRLDDLIDMGYTPQIEAFIWVQGTADSFTTESGSSYEATLELYLAAIITEFGPLPFIQSQQSILTGAMPGCLPVIGLGGVRMGKTNFTQNHDARLIETDDLILRDCWHYDAPSTKELGNRLAIAYLHTRADINDDHIVNVSDLLDLLGNWGNCPGCPEDLNFDDSVNVTDLLLMLSKWG